MIWSRYVNYGDHLSGERVRGLGLLELFMLDFLFKNEFLQITSLLRELDDFVVFVSAPIDYCKKAVITVLAVGVGGQQLGSRRFNLDYLLSFMRAIRLLLHDDLRSARWSLRRPGRLLGSLCPSFTIHDIFIFL